MRAQCQSNFVCLKNKLDIFSDSTPSHTSAGVSPHDYWKCAAEPTFVLIGSFNLPPLECKLACDYNPAHCVAFITNSIGSTCDRGTAASGRSSAARARTRRTGSSTTRRSASTSRKCPWHCGSGACAAIVAGRLQGLLDEHIEVELPGGKLELRWAGENTPIMMKGPARRIYEGRLKL